MHRAQPGEKRGPSKWKIFRTSAAPSFDVQHWNRGARGGAGPAKQSFTPPYHPSPSREVVRNIFHLPSPFGFLRLSSLSSPTSPSFLSSSESTPQRTSHSTPLLRRPSSPLLLYTHDVLRPEAPQTGWCVILERNWLCQKWPAARRAAV